MRGVLDRVPTHDDAADQPVRILHRCQAVSMIVCRKIGELLSAAGLAARKQQRLGVSPDNNHSIKRLPRDLWAAQDKPFFGLRVPK